MFFHHGVFPFFGMKQGSKPNGSFMKSNMMSENLIRASKKVKKKIATERFIE